MNFVDIDREIFEWVKAAVEAIPGVTTYWEKSGAPRPVDPAVKLSYLTGPTQIGLDQVSQIPGTPVTFQIIGQRTFIVSVNAYGPQSMQILSDLQTSISNPILMDGLSEYNLAILRTSPPRDINVASNTRLEARAQMDVTFLATEIKVISGLGPIDEITAEGDISGFIDVYTADSGG